MSNTLVLIRDEMGLRVPSILEIAASHGAGITFKAEDGADSVLYFNPEAASILVPNPGSHVALHAGAEISYSFGAVGSSPYGVITQAPEDSAPESFDFGTAKVPAVLMIQPGQGMDFPVPTNSTQTLADVSDAETN
jgi:hypothetical protein